MEESRNIPRAIKREIRQRCGFGCVVCGIPLYDYDHIEQFSEVNEHKAENLTLLCSMHHREKTNGLLSISQVREANLAPYNVVKGVSSPYRLNMEGSNFELTMGKCKLMIDNLNPQNDFIIPFLIDNHKLISFEIIDGRLFFNLVILNNDGELLLKVEENEMIYNSEQWDVEFVGTRMKLREGSRKIVLDMEFKIPNQVLIHYGEFYYKNHQIIVSKEGFMTSNLQLRAQTVKNFRIVFAIGEFDGKAPVAVRLN